MAPPRASLSVGPAFLRCDDAACSRHLPALAAAGFRQIEWARHWLDEPVLYGPADIDRHLDELRSAGLALGSVHGYVSYKPSLAEDHYLPVNRSRIDFCAAAGCGILVLHAPCPTLPDPRLAGRAALRQLRALLEPADQAGVRLAVENLLPSHQGDLHAFFDELFDKLPPHVGLCYDIAHAALAGCPDLPRRYPGRLLHVHASDNNLRNDQHRPLGSGRIDLPAAGTLLAELHYTGAVNLEVVRPARQSLPVFAAESLAAATALCSI